MYEKDGYIFSLEEVQAAADKNQLSLEEYIKSRGLKLTYKEKQGVPKSDHISREEFDFSAGKKVEGTLVKKLIRQYANTNLEFDEARMGTDAIRVKRTNDVDWTVFNLKSKWNARAWGVHIEKLRSQYDDFISFLDSDDATDQEAQIFEVSNLKPSVYIQMFIPVKLALVPRNPP